MPGHEKFIRNMVAGVNSIDIGLLVVSADDGIMPQTKEHFDILSYLKIPYGIVALNKIDLVDDEDWLNLIEHDIRRLLKNSFMENAPIIRVSTKNNFGIEKFYDKPKPVQYLSNLSLIDRHYSYYQDFCMRELICQRH